MINRHEPSFYRQSTVIFTTDSYRHFRLYIGECRLSVTIRDAKQSKTDQYKAFLRQNMYTFLYCIDVTH